MSGWDSFEEYYSSVYDSPESVNWETIGEVNWWEDSWSYDLTVLWRDKSSGTFYWGSDTGCSCSRPFDFAVGLESFYAGNKWDFMAYLNCKKLDYDHHGDEQVNQLIEKLMLGDY